MLITFSLNGRQFAITLVNGMTFEQYIERLQRVGVPVQVSCQQHSPPTGLVELIRSAKRAWEWEQVLRRVVEGNPQFPEE